MKKRIIEVGESNDIFLKDVEPNCVFIVFIIKDSRFGSKLGILIPSQFNSIKYFAKCLGDSLAEGNGWDESEEAKTIRQWYRRFKGFADFFQLDTFEEVCEFYMKNK